MLVDLHNHTCHFSPDAVMSIDTLIEAAVARHLSAVGITEHYEYDNPDPDDDVGIFDLDKYTDSFRNWYSKCPSSLKLLMGIEFGYQTHTSADIDRIASSAPFDVVILSNHLFRGRDVYYGGNKCYGLPKTIRHDEYINKIFAFVFLYISFIVGGAFVLTFCGMDIPTSVCVAAANIANLGPSPLINVMGAEFDYLVLMPVAKWTLIVLMLVGRVEIFSIIAIFSPVYWRR